MLRTSLGYFLEKINSSSNFFIEKPIQSVNKKILIQQSAEGLKVFIKDSEGNITPVDKHMIEGLPKMDLIPKDFFDSCCTRVLDSENKVYFTHNDEMVNEKKIMISNIPCNDDEIEKFYQNPEVLKKIEFIRSSGNFKLGNIIAYLQSGASATVGAYFYGKNFPNVCKSVTLVHDAYPTLMTNTSVAFTKIQTHNIAVVKSHISAAKNAFVGNWRESLKCLSLAPKHAEENIALCNSLIEGAERLILTIQEARIAIINKDHEIDRLAQDLQTNEKKLLILKDEIKNIEKELEEKIIHLYEIEELNYTKHMPRQEESQCNIKKMTGLNIIKRILLDIFTLGIYNLLYKIIEFKKIKKDKSEELIKIKKEINNLLEKKMRERDEELCSIMSKQEILDNMKKASNNFQSTDMAKSALQMAELGVSEVKLSIESYRDFMEKINEQTKCALHSLESLIKFGNVNIESFLVSRETKQVFAKDFQNSAHHWLGLCYFGKICRTAIDNCSQTVFNKLSLKTSDQNEQKKLAEIEMKELEEILKKRKELKIPQINYMNSMGNQEFIEESIKKLESDPFFTDF